MTAIERATRRFHKAREAAERELERLFNPLVTERIAAGDFAGALEVVRFMPDCVSRVFFIDRIRNARGDYK